MSRPPVDYIERTREQYGSLGYPPYQWAHNEDEPPFATVSKPLTESRIGLIASGGVYREGQIAFHYRDDFSFRVISCDTETSALRVTHFVARPASGRSARTRTRSWAGSTRCARCVKPSPRRSQSAWRKMRSTRWCLSPPDRCAINPSD